ncbi:Rne/Rng family ribonuclease [Pacificimonas sp. WHA3]|uniref:Ribonuclease E n=2 Tax=Pacificimonas pallii TaxID=2827236 RepID=A0ABS6SAW6_9SPHN|nr:Rne/Rng family ribonuclease [Pacificimonas pallii]
MLIDARHPEETRVAVANGTRIEEFDFESAARAQIKGNIYLAKVTRVEPSLQAAFIDYGGNRHGFLAFSEIHPDYYQIPKADREALLAEERAAAQEHADDLDEDSPHEGSVGDDEDHDDDDGETHSEAGGDDDHVDNRASDALRKKRQSLRKKYKIQEVIKRRQVLLVQVVKEERGNKGAAMTTYLSLAGRYSVLMPNTSHGGGISRKIASAADRKRLKSIVNEMNLPSGMGVIVRTAGAKRTKTEVKRDFDYLTRLWDGIRQTTLASAAPALIHEDSDLIKRAIRDLYSREIDEVLVDGAEGYKDARGFMKLLMPSHAKKVKAYEDPVPLFQRYRIEEQLAEMYHPTVQLKSGGYLVINPTEALVSIDINSGKSTREHSIEETAYKTNKEAAQEIARQLKLRDMSGLIVIDFIDMDHSSNVRKVEKALKEALKDDRARIQVGRISQFGLMEMSRQRLRTGVLEASTHTCPVCNGAGITRTTESAGLGAMRLVEAEALKGKNSEFTLHLPTDTAIYLLNEKRQSLANLEARYGISLTVCPEIDMHSGDIDLEARGGAPKPTVDISKPDLSSSNDDEDDDIEDEDDQGEDDSEENSRDENHRDGEDDGGRGRGRGRRSRGGRNRRGRGRRPAGDDDHAKADAEDEVSGESEANADPSAAASSGGDGDDEAPKRRRRGRRGGRGRRGRAGNEAGDDSGNEDGSDNRDRGDDVSDARRQAEKPVATSDDESSSHQAANDDAAEEKPKPRRRRAAKTVDASEQAESESGEERADEKPRPRRRRAAKTADASAEVKAEASADAETEAGVDAAKAADAPKDEKPKRTRKPRAAAKSADDAEEAKPAAPARAKPAARSSARSAAKTTGGKTTAAKTAAGKPTARSTAKPAPKAAAETAGAPADEQAADSGPKRKGWWQRTFG